MASDTDGTLGSARTAFQVMQLLDANDGLTVTELARKLDAAKSTAHRYLKSLYVEEYVIKDGDVYRVGLRALAHGIHARNRHDGYGLIRTKVDQLATETGERVNFMVPEHGKAVCLYQSLGERAVKLELGVADRVPLHTISAGKAILAQWSDERIDAYVDQYDLIEFTENTIADDETLREEVATIRARGYSQSKQEFTGELNGIGAPVRDADGTLLGAFGISGPTHRMRGERFDVELPELLLGTAHEITLNRQYAE